MSRFSNQILKNPPRHKSTSPFFQREYRIATLRQAIEEQTRDFKAPFIIHVSDLEKCVTAEDIYYFFGGADKLDDIFFFQDDEADHVLVEFNNLEALIEALMKNGTVFFKKQIKIQYVEACKNRCYVIPKTSDAVEPSPPPLSSSKEPEVSPSDSVQWRATNNQSPRYSEQPPRSSDSNRRGDSRPRGSGNRRDGAPRSNERRNGPRSNDRQRDAYPRSNERRDGPPRNDRPQLASYSDSKDRPRQPKPPHSNDARQQYERSSNRAPPSKYDMQGGSRGSRPSQAQPEFVVPPPPQLKAQQNLPKPDEPQVPKPAEPATTKPAEKKNPFGEARPMDTQKRMLEMDEKLRNEKATKPVVEAKPTQPTTTEYSKPVQVGFWITRHHEIAKHGVSHTGAVDSTILFSILYLWTRFSLNVCFVGMLSFWQNMRACFKIWPLSLLFFQLFPRFSLRQY